MSYQSYELRRTKNEEIVPVVNDIHLHSIYDPQKEALQFVKRYEQVLQENNCFLVLGLGFGYHIEAMANFLKDKKDFSIVVVEPNVQLINDFNEHKGFSHKEIAIVSPINAQELFENSDFVGFLKNKPSILKHDLSYEIDTKFYSELLSFKAPQRISEYRHLFSNSVDAEISEKEELSLSENLNIIKSKTGAINNVDFALLALESLT